MGFDVCQDVIIQPLRCPLPSHRITVRHPHGTTKDAMSCRCASGYGANLLGKCVPAAGPLQAMVVMMRWC